MDYTIKRTFLPSFRFIRFSASKHYPTIFNVSPVAVAHLQTATHLLCSLVKLIAITIVSHPWYAGQSPNFPGDFSAGELAPVPVSLAGQSKENQFDGGRNVPLIESEGKAHRLSAAAQLRPRL